MGVPVHEQLLNYIKHLYLSTDYADFYGIKLNKIIYLSYKIKCLS